MRSRILLIRRECSKTGFDGMSADTTCEHSEGLIYENDMFTSAVCLICFELADDYIHRSRIEHELMITVVKVKSFVGVA